MYIIENMCLSKIGLGTLEPAQILKLLLTDFLLTMFLYAYVERTVKFQSALCVYFSFYFYNVLETSYGSKFQYCRSVCIC